MKVCAVGSVVYVWSERVFVYHRLACERSYVFAGGVQRVVRCFLFPFCLALRGVPKSMRLRRMYVAGVVVGVQLAFSALCDVYFPLCLAFRVFAYGEGCCFEHPWGFPSGSLTFHQEIPLVALFSPRGGDLLFF